MTRPELSPSIKSYRAISLSRWFGALLPSAPPPSEDPLESWMHSAPWGGGIAAPRWSVFS